MRTLPKLVLAALALAGGPAACVSYELPALEPIQEPPPLAATVYVVPADVDERYFSSMPDEYVALFRAEPWRLAAGFASELEAAGLQVRVAPSLAAVPADAPVVQLDETGLSSGRCFSDSPIPVVTFGVLPALSCVPFGHRLDVRRTPSAEPVRVDTFYQVHYAAGWIGPLLNLLPGRSCAIPPELGAERERRALLAAIARSLLPEAQP